LISLRLEKTDVNSEKNSYNEERERERESKFKPNAVNEGDGLELLRSLSANSAKLVFFDPQYSQVKDVIKVHQAPMIYQDQENIQEFLKEIARVLKPSGFCLF